MIYFGFEIFGLNSLTFIAFHIFIFDSSKFISIDINQQIVLSTWDLLPDLHYLSPTVTSPSSLCFISTGREFIESAWISKVYYSLGMGRLICILGAPADFTVAINCCVWPMASLPNRQSLRFESVPSQPPLSTIIIISIFLSHNYYFVFGDGFRRGICY